MAYNKQKHVWPLFVHSSLYTLILFACSELLLENPVSIWGIAIIFIGHLILDHGKFIAWWHKQVTRSTDMKNALWLKIIYDQIFHLILIVIALQV
jgi:hypothetical protein